jgi:hypothetical protein
MCNSNRWSVKPHLLFDVDRVRAAQTQQFPGILAQHFGGLLQGEPRELVL